MDFIKNTIYLFNPDCWDRDFHMICDDIDDRGVSFYHKEVDIDDKFSDKTVHYPFKRLNSWYKEGHITVLDICPDELFIL